ncbi:MAG TPA: DUF2255 family protein [Candidatus Acidoferrum sp.]|nr:DUF2255 family protein [Candidatus Acidoferrum sp.]
MTKWTTDELTRIGRAEELQIASLRRDGTLRNPVTIWVVPHDGGLYVRSVRGRTAAWFRGAQERHEAQIRAGGVEKDVTLVDAVHDIDAEVDAAYRAKYRRYAGSVLNSVLTPDARSTTIKLEPRV